MHPPAIAEKIPMENRSMMMNSTVTLLHANIIHMKQEHALHKTSMIRLPKYCANQPPTKKPMMLPRDRAAPEIKFEFNWMKHIFIQEQYPSMRYPDQRPQCLDNHV